MRHSEHYSPYSTNVINIEDAQSGPPSTALRHSQSSSPTSQKRKIERACDFCRRRKTRCDGPKTPGNICTNCIQNQKSCTYVESSKPRGPPKAYVTALEDRVENLEAYLQKLRPDVDFSDVLGPPVVRDSWRNEHPGRKSRSPQVSISANRPIRRSTSTPTFTSGYLASSFAVTVAGPDWASSSIAGSPRPFISRPMLSSAPDRQTTDDVYSDNESMFSDDSTTSDSECYGELDYGKEVKRIMVQDQGVAQDSFTMDLSENELSESEAIPCCWRRFHGKSSSIRLVGSARRMKLRHMTEVRSLQRTRNMSNTSSSQQLRRKSPEKRKEFWVMPSWEIAFEGVHIGPEHFASMVSANMPPPELAESLISLYFQHANVQFPLLHWPTFHKLWVSGCHHNDVWFTCMCFAMFAVASRWSDDERVLCDVNSVTCGLPHAPTAEEIPKLKWRTAGWKYHNVVVDIIAVKRSILQPATLFEIQSCTLIAMFLWGTSHYPNSWLAIEIGVRKAQDKGIHRRKAYNNVPQVKAELWKRAWWLLVAFDRITSASLGRTCCTRDEDFDIDLPLEVDDEYWEPPDANLAFRQPPGKPSLVTAFNSWVRLTQITAFTVRTFYAVDKSQGLLRLLGPDWRSRMVKKMNAALAQWYETVPAHLRWSSTMENKTFANQAVTLFTTYHLARIMIYRPFIRAPDAPPESQHYPGSPGMENSELAICTEAARECARIIATQLQRGFSNVYNLISVSHICAALLLMNVWDIKAKQTMEAHSPYEPTVDMMTIPEIQSLLSDVAVFLRALEYASDRWSMAATHL
ncbi:hypothetical protein NEOLEDRAFT_1057311 [Neolentinus lepideus HHB14362 ss-1]|uniref:Zn(2)-C6 fungal-type domain-containing protein n=1 Tax=Neolentinus lepideus HHB14362 ss-1 TaxID=1314782 RepID=A0A165V0F9_9AGAM|nr:hypothetical protein NEOLEDRAFT_1057311 [Neolentinus lepideus HHB14362 ss-1]